MINFFYYAYDFRLKVCDGVPDCSDSSDETMCGGLIRNRDRTHRPPVAEAVPTEPLVPVSSTNREVVKGKEEEETPAEPSVDFMDYNEIRPVMTDSVYDTDLEPASQIKLNNSTTTTTTTQKPSLFNVRVYPDTQWVYGGNDAVIQCRDEGDLRAAVAWRTKDGRALPQGATQEWGRLSLPKMHRKQAGIYVCFVDGQEETLGASAEATVQVKSRHRRRRRRRRRHRV